MTHEKQMSSEHPGALAVFDSLISDESKTEERQAIDAALQHLAPEMVNAEEAEIMDGIKQAVRDESDGSEARLEGLKNDLRQLDLARKYYYRAGVRKYEMERCPEQLWLDLADEGRVEPIKNIVQSSPMLEEQVFIKTVPDVSDLPQIILEGNRDNTLSIPTRNLISADDFSSWERGRDKTNKEKMGDNGVTSSVEVIKDYAHRDTPAPPIEHVTGYIQPNGIIVYTVNGGTHRAAAAIMRGDTTIETQQLRLAVIDRNLVDN